MYGKQNKPILATLFLLNNYQYISKFLKTNGKVLDMCGKDLDNRVAILTESKRQEYFTGYVTKLPHTIIE